MKPELNVFPTQFPLAGENAGGDYNTTQHKKMYDREEGKTEEENNLN